MKAEIIVKNEKGEVVQKVLVGSNNKVEVEWNMPIVDGDLAYGGFEFEFTGIYKIRE